MFTSVIGKDLVNALQVNNILECSSLRDVVRLATRSFRISKLGFACTCLFWVLVNIVSLRTVQGIAPYGLPADVS